MSTEAARLRVKTWLCAIVVVLSNVFGNYFMKLGMPPSLDTPFDYIVTLFRPAVALGVALLTRGRQGVSPTQAGRTLLQHARTILRQAERLAEIGYRLRIGGAAERPVTGLAPPVRCGLITAGLVEMVGDQLRLGLIRRARRIAQQFGNTHVQCLPSELGQGFIGRLAQERVREAVGRLRQRTTAKDQLGLFKPLEPADQGRIIELRETMQRTRRVLKPASIIACSFGGVLNTSRLGMFRHILQKHGQLAARG